MLINTKCKYKTTVNVLKKEKFATLPQLSRGDGLRYLLKLRMQFLLKICTLQFVNMSKNYKNNIHLYNDNEPDKYNFGK